MHGTFPLSFSLALALSSLAIAQDLRVGDARSMTPRLPIHTAEPDGGTPYGIWAAGHGYKASFHGDVTFVPYLGTSYPENQPLSWRSLSVRCGDTELMNGERTVRRCADFRCEIDLGGVTETWDVLEAGLEQSFVVDQRPASAGDLVVTGRISTPLHAAPFAAQHRAIEFADGAGRTLVRWGEAFAIDARGERIAITTSYEGGEVRLRVPADWMHGAQFPIVVDPLVSVVGWLLPDDAVSPDVIRDDSGNDLMMVYSLAASATDFDAYARLSTDAWGSSTIVFTDINATWSTPIVKVAVAADPQKYCVVMERQLPDRRIRAHIHDSNDFVLSTAVVFLPTAVGTHDWRPDVGGQVVSTSAFSSTGTEFLIVFQRDVPPGGVFSNTNGTAIFGRTLNADGTFAAEFPIALGVLSVQDHEFPCVNQQARRTGSAVQRTDWMVVFQRYVGPEATWRTMGRLVSDNGTLDPAFWYSTGSSASEHRLMPHVGGQVGRYVVSHVETPFALAPFKTTATAGHAWGSERVDWTPGSAPTNHPLRLHSGVAPQARFRVGDVAYDTATRSHWALTVAETAALGGTGDQAVLRVGFDGIALSRSILNLSGQVVAGGICFDDDNGLFVLSSIRQSGAFSAAVWGGKYIYDDAAPIVVSGVSCSSGDIAWGGSQQIGSEFSSIILTSAPATIPAFAMASLAPVDVNLSALGFTGCRLLVDIAAPNYITMFGTATSASGSASVQIPLSSTLPPADIFFQWLHLDVGANVHDLVTTQQLYVQLVK